MKNNLTTGLLAIGLAVLYILHFTSSPSTGGSEPQEIVAGDTNQVDSLPEAPIVIDTTFLEQLKEAEYSKVGYLDLWELVRNCPVLKVDAERIEKKQGNIIREKNGIEQQFNDYRVRKTKELKDKYDINLLTESEYQNAQNELQVRGEKAQEELRLLALRNQKLEAEAMKVAEKRQNIIKSNLDELNKVVKLDYILVKEQANSSVYALNEDNPKNNITDDLVKLINSNSVK